MAELRIDLGLSSRRPVAPDSPTHRAILAIGRQITEGYARVRLTVAEGWVRRLPRIHYADHLTGGDQTDG